MTATHEKHPGVTDLVTELVKQILATGKSARGDRPLAAAPTNDLRLDPDRDVFVAATLSRRPESENDHRPTSFVVAATRG